MRIPLRRGRRKTTLPSLQPARTAATFSDAMKTAFIGDVRAALNRPSLLTAFGQTDPWDEAIRSIERRKEAEAEWPWPAKA